MYSDLKKATELNFIEHLLWSRFSAMQFLQDNPI